MVALVGAQSASAQGPTIDTNLPLRPGSNDSELGPSPGGGGGLFSNPPGANDPILSGRAGPTAPHVPGSVTMPGAGAGPTDLQTGISAPKPKPTPTVPTYGPLSLTQVAEDEGPANGLTLDMAIDAAIRDNLDLRSKYYEIPQARADILQAGLRANPIFYADSQLIPYGSYNKAKPGGPTQYDVNVSHPFDLSRKRQARVMVACRALKVLEAQYQDAIRISIDLVYSAFVDALVARQTIRYSQSSVEGLEKLLDVERKRYELDQSTRADVGRVEILLDSAKIGLLDAQQQYGKTKQVLANLLNIPPEHAESFEIRGTLLDRFNPPAQLPELQRMALEMRPDVASFRLGIQRAEADVKLALANRFSDIYVLYQPYTNQYNGPLGGRSTTSWALGVTVPLPIYNRNQGGIQRAKLNVTQTQIQLDNMARQTMSEVAQAYKEYTTTRQIVQKIERETIPVAKRVLSDSFRLYTGGEQDVTFYLNAQKNYNDLVKQYLDSLSRHRRSMLALNTAIGLRVLP